MVTNVRPMKENYFIMRVMIKEKKKMYLAKERIIFSYLLSFLPWVSIMF